MKTLLALIAFYSFGSCLLAVAEYETAEMPLNQINWISNIEKAKSISVKSGRPLFELSGQTSPAASLIWNHPLIIETIEEQFVPVRNSAQTNYTIALKSGDENELLPAQAVPADIDQMVDWLQQALIKSNRSVPAYLDFVRPAQSSNTQTAEFAMHCYWEGEAKLGSIDGVRSTRSAWRGGLEVVQLEYSPEVVEYETLLKAAQQFECASKVFTHSKEQHSIATRLVGRKAQPASGPVRDAKASDQKYYLLHTIYKYLPLTERQATKINSLAKYRRSATGVLSQRQTKLLKAIESAVAENKNALTPLKYPENPDSLGEYQQRLVAKLKMLGTM